MRKCSECGDYKVPQVKFLWRCEGCPHTVWSPVRPLKCKCGSKFLDIPANSRIDS